MGANGFEAESHRQTEEVIKYHEMEQSNAVFLIFFIYIFVDNNKKDYYQPYPLNMTAKSCRNTVNTI